MCILVMKKRTTKIIHTVIRTNYRPHEEVLVITEFNYENKPLRSYHVRVPNWREQEVYLEHDYYFSPKLN